MNYREGWFYTMGFVLGFMTGLVVGLVRMM
jgi:hypothetical protein